MENINKNNIKKCVVAASVVITLLLPSKGIAALEPPKEHLDKWCSLNKYLGVEHQVDKINSIPGYNARYSSDGVFDASELENGKYYAIYNDGTTKEFIINNDKNNVSKLPNGEIIPQPMHFSEQGREVILVNKETTITDYYQNGNPEREETTRPLPNGNIESVISIYDENGSLKSELKQIRTPNDVLVQDIEIIYNRDKKVETIKDFYENGTLEREETINHLQNDNVETIIKIWDASGNLKSELRQIHDSNGNLVEDKETKYNVGKTK